MMVNDDDGDGDFLSDAECKDSMGKAIVCVCVCV